MKEIKAILQPFKVAEVVDALQALPHAIGITEVAARGFGHRRRLGEEADAKGAVHSLFRTMLLIIVPDGLADQVVETIRSAAHTGNPGDGHVFVTAIETAVRIRTGSHGDEAL